MRKTVLLVASLLLFAASSRAAIVVQQLSPTHIVMNSTHYNVEARSGQFRIQPISPDPRIRVGVATISWDDSVDEFSYDNGTAPFCRGYAKLRLPLTGWTHAAERAPDGSVTISGNATTASGCFWKFGFMFVENDTVITMPEMSTTVQPNQVKLSIESHCPWRQQIRYIEPTLGPTEPLYLRGRMARAGLRTNFEFGASLNNIFYFNFPKFFPIAMERHMQLQCETNVSSAVVSDFRPLPWNYTFDDSVGIVFPFEAGKFAIGMLTWARSDSGRHTWAVPLANDTRIASDGRSFLVVMDIYFEFADDPFYDPTLDILFDTRSDSAPVDPGSPAAAVLAADNTAISIAIGVVVAVVIIAAIIIMVFVMRSPTARAKIMPYRRRRAPDNDRPEKESQTTSNDPNDQYEKNETFARPASPSTWSTARPMNRNL